MMVVMRPLGAIRSRSKALCIVFATLCLSSLLAPTTCCVERSFHIRTTIAQDVLERTVVDPQLGIYKGKKAYDIGGWLLVPFGKDYQCVKSGPL